MKKRIGCGLLAISLVLSLLVAISPNVNAATTIYASDVLAEAKKTIGSKYVSGEYTSPEKGFDCSGLIYYIYHTRLGYPMTRNQTIYTNQLAALGTKITDESQLLPGDLVEYNNGTHVGIYIGNNKIIHAATKEDGTPDKVKEGPLKYSGRKFYFGIRLNRMVMDVGGGQTVTKPSQPAVSVVSRNSGTWNITVPANYKLLCYANTTDTRNSTYIKAQSKAYTIRCTETASLSNGKTRYFFVSGDKKSLWFDFDTNLMSSVNLTPSQEETYQKQYTVYFDPNGGLASQFSKTVAAGSLVGSLPTATREGYTFVGWSTNKNTTGMILQTGNEMYVEEDTVLYAVWRDNSKYTITLNANGGVVSIKYRQVTVGETYGTLPIPVRDGYSFDGWYTSEAGGTKIDQSSIVRVQSDQTLFAHWKQDKGGGGDWGSWSDWSDSAVSASDTRQVETRQVEDSPARTEYRYVGYVYYDYRRHECWCETYMKKLFGSATLRYSNWSTTRYSPGLKDWTCGNCQGNHVGVDHYTNGKPYWHEYLLPDGDYYWEETRTVAATQKTQYRYRDWITD